MNAPASAAALQVEHELVPLASIAPSETHIQQMRRKRFKKEALAELAASIGKVGVLQPLVIRPLAALRGLAKYELVCGERRWIAAEQAGLAHAPCTIRKLTDEEVLEVQLIENLQREGLHELEEAEGYDELRKLKKIGADEIAALIGKSRAYVFNRLKLLDLCPEAREACYAGKLPASTAMLVARIGHHDTQRAALQEILQSRFKDAEPLSYRVAREVIERNFMLQLKGAPFDQGDEKLVPKAGSCLKCPKRTGNQRELFADVKSPDVCTDPKCFQAKRVIHFQRQREKLQAEGKKVITGDDAKKIMPHGDSYQAHGGYLKLDQRVYDDPKNRTVAELIGKDRAAVEYVEVAGDDKLIEVVPAKAVTAALNAKGIKTASQKVAGQRKKSGTTGSSGKESDDALQNEIERRQVLAVAKAAPARLGKPELLRVFAYVLEDYEVDHDETICAVMGWKEPLGGGVEAKLAKCTEAQLSRCLVACLYFRALGTYGEHEVRLFEKAYKVDKKKIAKAVKAEQTKAADANIAKAIAAGKAAANAEEAAAQKKKGGKEDEWPFPTGSKPPSGAQKKKASKPKAKAKAKAKRKKK